MIPAPTYSNACPEVDTVLTRCMLPSVPFSTDSTPGNNVSSATPPYSKFSNLIASSSMSCALNIINCLSA